MSTRFYYGQLDYITQLNLMDDIATASATSAAAYAAAAAQSAADAADSASQAAAPIASVGLGITTAAPYMSNIDDAAVIAGFWYVNSSTTGTFPVSASPGMVIHKVYGTAGFQMYQPHGSNNIYYRRRNVSAWQAWIELASMTVVNTKEPAITAGTTAQYWRGDKTWQTHDKASVGLGNADDTSDANKPVSTAQAAADAATLASANTYADGLVVSMWDDRGNYDASSNTFPTTGGSGSAGAVKKNDIWTISVAGTLGGTPVAVRQFIRALIDTPGQTASNWAIGLASTDIDDSITDGVIGRAPSQNAVFDALALKAPLASPSLTGTPTAPTASVGTNSTQLATTAFVQGEKASPTFTGTTTVDNLTFSGVGRRIIADFTNTTQTSRTLFQTSTANSVSAVGVIPSGTGTGANLNVFNNSDPTNAGVMQLGINSTFASVNSFITGTGTYLPLSFMTGGAERFKLAATTNRLQANFSQGATSTQFMFQDSTTNALTSVGALPNGTGTTAQYAVFNNSNPDNCSFMRMSINGTIASLRSEITGSGTVLPMMFYVGASELIRADTNGNVGFFGSAPSNNGTQYRNLSMYSGTTGLAGTIIEFKNSADVQRASISSDTSWGLNLQSNGALPMTFRVNGSERARFTSNGFLVVGQVNEDPITTRANGLSLNPAGNIRFRASGAQLDVAQANTSGSNIQFYTDNGSGLVTAGTITSNGSTTAYNTSSDYRLKVAVKPMTNALDFIKQIQFCTWMWEMDGREGEGVLAHKLQELSKPIPDAVHGEKDAVDVNGNPVYQGVDYSKLVPRLGCAVQELSVLLEQAFTRIAILENQGA